MKKRNIQAEFEEKIISLFMDNTCCVMKKDLHALVEKYTDLIRKEGLSDVAFSEDDDDLIKLQ